MKVGTPNRIGSFIAPLINVMTLNKIAHELDS